ncbi:MAG TPA: type II secretion system F family protein [Phycisphaerales bacterium]|nr:type II secretion system F family protein [Phycisphaerales bacterium]|tara:strand:- start:3316 stop:4527 length:1212 start_codon:yes stop_codon:yes gene_type:complete
MHDFHFDSLTNSGEVRSGIMSGIDRADIIRQLDRRGETATKIEKMSGRKKLAHSHKKRSRRSMSHNETATLIRELATALEAGLPLMQSLKTIRQQATPASGEVLDHLIQAVEAGDPLYKAAKEWGKPFDDLIVGMLHAADASGNMSDILHQLADLMDRSLELRRELVGAIMYPAIIACLIGMSGIVLVTVLIPRLIGPLAGEMELPWPTKVVMGFADFIKIWWPWILGTIFAAIVGWKSWTNSTENRLKLDRFKLRIPLLGPLLRDVAVTRFTRTLGTLTSAGLPILDGLSITKDTLGNAALSNAIEDVQEEVRAGRPIASPLEKSGLFPPLLVQVVNLGERSGKLEEMLLHSATSFDRQVNASLKMFTKALPPILLIVMAGLASFVLAAILLPLLEMQSLVR